MKDPTYLCVIRSVLGRSVPIEELGPDEGALEHFREQGARYVRIAEAPPKRMAFMSAGATLRHAAGSWGFQGDDLDLVVVSTRNRSLSTQPMLISLVGRLGIPWSTAFAVGGQSCGNFGIAVRSLGGMLGRAPGGCGLLVFANAFLGTADRFLAINSAVVSDGAVSCLVTRRPLGPSFRIIGMRSASRADVDLDDIVHLTPTPSLTKAGFTAVRALVARLADDLGSWPAGYRWVLLNNYGRRVHRFYALAAGVPEATIYADNVGRNGHCHSGDPLINLESLVELGIVEAGDRVLVINDGLTCWTAMALEFEAG